MKLVGFVAVFAALVAVYVLWIRPYLRTLPGLSEIYDRLDAKERSWWTAFKVWLDGRKTVWTGILGTLVAIGPDLIDGIAGIDLKSLLHLPDAWAVWASQVTALLMMVFRIKAKLGD